MTDTSSTNIVKGNQLNAAGNINIGHMGDVVQAANAYLNISDKVTEKLLGEALGINQEDFTSDLPFSKQWEEPETMFVSAGEFLMGHDLAKGVSDYETPQFQMYLPDFRIGKHPVTNRQFLRFVEEFDAVSVSSVAWGWTNRNKPEDNEMDLPIKGVTWYEALAYCSWLSLVTKRPYTLPSEAQWEKAARGPEGNIFPWGNEWQDDLCNTNYEVVTAVTQFSDGKSHYQCGDMVGNIREWTTSLWGRNRKYNLDEIMKYPWENKWVLNSHQDTIKKNQQIRRVTRGGTALLPGIPLRAARRGSEFPYQRGIHFARVGFRVALNWEMA